MRCADCSSWEIDLDEKSFGLCKCYAPSPTIAKIEEGTKYEIVWPKTGKDDFCRQFQTRIAGSMN